MVIEFNDWINQRKDLDEGTKEILYESVKCFRIESYRASFIMAYIGFLSILQNRILNSQPPKGYSKVNWNNFQSKCRNSDAWDAEIESKVIPETINQPIFDDNRDLKITVKFFKTLRNNCAHGKKYEINNHHVITLWSFIMQKFNCFAVGGSLQYLIEKTKKHFDVYSIDFEKPFDEIAEEIVSSIIPEDMSKFLSELYEFNKIEDPSDGDNYGIQDNFFFILFSLIKRGNTDINNNIKSWIRTNDTDFVNNQILVKYPDVVNFFEFDNIEIRKAWKNFTKIESKEMRLIVNLLRNLKIPLHLKAPIINVFPLLY